MFNLKDFSGGIEQKSMLEETKRLITKWEPTGLLDDLSEAKKGVMVRLFENEAKYLLTEASQQADVVGFQNVAFPIVRRVFAGLIANELVSVQPMSLPAGLLFYMDYRFDSVKAGNKDDAYAVGGSLFGKRSSPQHSSGTQGFFNLGTSFSQREKIASTSLSGAISTPSLADIGWDPELSGSATIRKITLTNGWSTLAALADADTSMAALKQTVPVSASSINASTSTDGTPVQIAGVTTIYRRHTTKSGNDLVFIVEGAPTAGVEALKLSYVVGSRLTGGTSGTQYFSAFESDLGSTPVPTIPEIDFRIESTPVVAQDRKLKARWTPELAQDLAAYQNLDAEVELTQVMSELVALEIDREILADLLYNATGANYFWSRAPGKFLDYTTGNTVSGASFTGTVREWYETFIETILQAANAIYKKTLRGSANFLVTSPEVATILEASVLYKPSLPADPKDSMMTVGTEKVGTLNSRFTVYKDPYFPTNKVLLGYKGGSFLETGYVYAPYVPLIVTPTIYAPDDFTPRKAVMTRYAKKLVRSDFYGTVTVMDLNII